MNYFAFAPTLFSGALHTTQKNNFPELFVQLVENKGEDEGFNFFRVRSAQL